MITPVKYPYTGLWANYNGVYNGLNFIVDSDQKYVPGFRYICEIFAGYGPTNVTTLSKVGELRHNPDISYNNQGVFDVGRVLEDFITYNLAWNSLGLNDNKNHYKKYYCQFGEEKARTAKISKIENGGGKFKITLATPHDMQSTYWSALIQGTSLGQLNEPWAVLQALSPTTFTVALPYQSGVSWDNAYIIQGAYASGGLQTYTGADGMTYYSFRHAGGGGDAAYADVGDGIVVYSTDPGKTFVQGSWQILDKYYDSNSESFVYKTNMPYVNNMNGIPVHIFPQSTIQRKNLWTTNLDNSVAFNAVFQYEDILDYDVKAYAPYQNTAPLPTTLAKFLTYRPRTKMQMCLSDYYSLGFLGQDSMPVNGMSRKYAKNTMGACVEVWTKSKPSPISTAGAGNNITNGSTIINLGAKYANYTAIILTGSATNDFTAGSYITVSFWTRVGSTWSPGTYTGRIIKSLIAPATGFVILIDKVWASNQQSGTLHQWTITVTQRVILRPYDFSLDGNSDTRLDKQPAVQAPRWELGMGPKNLALNNCQEFQTDDVIKYFVYLLGYDANLQTNTTLNSCLQKYVKASETWEIEIVPCCSTYTPYTVFWLNKLGGWDYYTFKQRTDKVRAVEARNQFRRSLYNYGTFTNGQKGQSTYTTLSNDEWTLNTDWLTQAEVDWLQELYESPEVFIILKDHTNEFLKAAGTNSKDIILPVNITNEQIILGDKRNRGEKGGLFQYSITAAAANRRENLRGSNFGGNYFYNRA